MAKGPNTDNRTVGFQNRCRGTEFAGHVSTPSGTQVGESQRISGYGYANPAYARQAYYATNFDQGNVFNYGGGSENLSYAAARSGVVQVAGYSAIQTAAEVNARLHAKPSRRQPLGMGHSNTTGFGFRSGVVINSMTRLRMTGNIWRSSGWRGLLTQSLSSNKAFSTGAGGRGQSSEDSTTEVYSTQETRMGTRAAFTDEVWNEAKGKIGQTWAGFNALGQTGGTAFLPAQLGQMYVRENPNVGFARRVKRGL